MDKQTARKNLKELRDSINHVLGQKASGDAKADAEDAIKQTNEAAKQLKKSLLERVKDFPVIQKVSELGTAGTIAVSTAAVAQTELATDLTQVFVAEIAEDVREERFEVPAFVDTFVDFDGLYVWGQEVIQEKVAEAQELTSQPSQSMNETPSDSDSTPDSESVSDSESSDNSSETDTEQTEAEQGTEETETEESKSSEETTESESESTEDSQEETQETETEDSQESQESDASSESTESSEPVKTEVERVETTIDEVKPHQLVSGVQ